MYKYSPSTRGFYYADPFTEDNYFPDDSVDVSDDEHQELMNGQGQGKEITPGSDGRPILTDPPSADPMFQPTPEEKLNELGLTKEDLKALLK
jgi:hypothetical protein